MARTKKEAPLDLDTLLRERKKIYVKNTSRPLGHVILAFHALDGKPIPQPIPRTWIPICLTDTLPPEVISGSRDLRLFINKGILALVDPDKAIKILEADDAQEEVRRLNQSEFSAHASKMTDRVLELSQARATGYSNEPAGPVEGFTSDGVSDRVKTTILRVEAKDLTERDAVTELRIMKEELSTHDFSYIISSIKEEGPLRRFALQLLSERSAAVDPDVVADDEDEDPPEDPEQAARGRRNQQV